MSTKMRILTTGIKYFKPELIGEFKWTSMNKPLGKFLWGSTMKTVNGGMVTSDWNEFCQLDYTGKAYSFGISYTLYKNSKICEVGCFEDYVKILDQYHIDEENVCCIRRSLDFSVISKEFDAFHVSEQAMAEMRLPRFGYDERSIMIANYFHNFDSNLRPVDFYAYDTESWIIFNPDCINKDSVLNHDNVYNYGVEPD